MSKLENFKRIELSKEKLEAWKEAGKFMHGKVLVYYEKDDVDKLISTFRTFDKDQIKYSPSDNSQGETLLQQLIGTSYKNTPHKKNVHSKLVTELLELGADPNVPVGRNILTPLGHALVFSQSEPFYTPTEITVELMAYRAKVKWSEISNKKGVLDPRVESNIKRTFESPELLNNIFSFAKIFPPVIDSLIVSYVYPYTKTIKEFREAYVIEDRIETPITGEVE